MNLVSFKTIVLAETARRPKANWVSVGGEQNNGSGIGQCSICNQQTSFNNFCPNCGATFLSEERIENRDIHFPPTL